MTLTGIVAGAQWFFLGYFLALNLAYMALTLLAVRFIGQDDDARASLLLPRYFSGLEPPVSLLVPAYNEEATIASSIRSMLQLEYPHFEIIVVNDGSKDRTLAVLQEEFELVPFPEAYRVAIPTRPIRAIYRSLRHASLRVIDKENGGKSDALNAGINAARSPLFCAVDADSILQRDSLHRVARPFLEDPTTIASGGTIRLANGCRVSEGFLEEVGMPGSWLARIQIVEYLRAFLFGRLGWSPLNAMLIVSGAFGLFRRNVVIEAGGYRTDTVGEDMELVVRLHRLHRLARKPYRIVFVPDPICWTEAPESLTVLRSQRSRWQRGLLESLTLNRRLLFHPRGGAPGWLAFPTLNVTPNVIIGDPMGTGVDMAFYPPLQGDCILLYTVTLWPAWAGAPARLQVKTAQEMNATTKLAVNLSIADAVNLFSTVVRSPCCCPTAMRLTRHRRVLPIVGSALLNSFTFITCVVYLDHSFSAFILQ